MTNQYHSRAIKTKLQILLFWPKINFSCIWNFFFWWEFRGWANTFTPKVTVTILKWRVVTSILRYINLIFFKIKITRDKLCFYRKTELAVNKYLLLIFWPVLFNKIFWIIGLRIFLVIFVSLFRLLLFLNSLAT